VTSFTSALVHHIDSSPYSRVVRGLSTRNEPQDFKRNWIGGSAGDFARYQHAVYAAAHSVSDRVAILNGGTEQFPASLVEKFRRRFVPTPYETQETAFAQALYKDPLWCRSLDILDLHPGDRGPVYSPEMVHTSV
jgi:hypothetical protein